MRESVICGVRLWGMSREGDAGAETDKLRRGCFEIVSVRLRG
jgi:hypothetical protein